MIDDVLRRSDIFEGLDDAEMGVLAALARRRAVRAGEYAFLLGESADRICVVLAGKMELCFPLSIRGISRDISLESKLPGEALGWSALVKPYRFTLSARATDPSELAEFLRRDLIEVFGTRPGIGYKFMGQIANTIGRRLVTIQALWARQLQQTVSENLSAGADNKMLEDGSSK